MRIARAPPSATTGPQAGRTKRRIAVSAWKPLSLCLLLILSLVSAVAASPAPSHASNTASAASVAAAASAAPLWAPGAHPASCAGETAGSELPVLGSRTCSLRFCSGTGGCVCSNGQHGTCSNGLCVI